MRWIGLGVHHAQCQCQRQRQRRRRPLHRRRQAAPLTRSIDSTIKEFLRERGGEVAIKCFFICPALQKTIGDHSTSPDERLSSSKSLHCTRLSPIRKLECFPLSPPVASEQQTYSSTNAGPLRFSPTLKSTLPYPSHSPPPQQSPLQPS